MEYNLAALEFSPTQMIALLPRARARRRGASSTAAEALLFAALSIVMPAAAQTSSAPAQGKRPQSAANRTKGRADVARFRARVEATLNEAHAERAYWGVLVTDRETGETLYELNAGHFFTPGSNAKVFTTAFALAALGPDFRFHTTLDSKTNLEAGGRLAGDLIFSGSGDPDLSNRKFPYAGKVEREGPVEKILAEIVDAAVAKGLKEVAGDIVADDSLFPYDPYPAGWSIGDLFFSFGAPVGAIALNENSLTLNVSPGAQPGDPAMVVVEPGVAINGFGQEITTSPASDKPELSVVRRPGLNFILLRGSIPLGHPPVKLDLAMTDPAETAARTLKQLLEDRGVRVMGGVRVQHSPPPERTASGEVSLVPRPAPNPHDPLLILAEHISPPLLESVRLTNKLSQNLHAELFLRKIASEKNGIGTTDVGLKLEQDFLKSAGIADGDVVLTDGSGLAGSNLITPQAMVQLLLYAFHQPWGEDFLSTLPIAGMDGTLENRLKGTAAAGLIQAKTGTLEHDHAISGYATTTRGEHLVFAILENNNPQKGHEAVPTLDEIAVAMVETLGAPPPKKKKK
ncbi:MAG: D-alanyl-D-alanine carboxypeptidase/D-alanyl-D-alanine-endopeptidase [Candidatus Acidiferrales bacterium]